VRVVLSIDSVEPTEKSLTAGSLRRIVVLRLRTPVILVSALVPAASSVLILVGGAQTRC
jgi:hypothetical protein